VRSEKVEGEKLHEARARAPGAYLAMYSSYTGSIVTDPAWMLVPVDDHLVHRGDGIFETLKAEQGTIYNVRAHLERLERSADALKLNLPESPENIGQRIVETMQAGGQDDVLIRVMVSRGPGSLGVNPYDCPQSQLYIIVAPLPPPFMTRHPEGAHIAFSSVAPKPSPFSDIKSCNYLPNAMMAMEARDRGVDFVLACTSDGFVLEGPTENVAILTVDRRLISPAPPGLLSGTTLERVWTLAESVQDIQYIGREPLRPSDLREAAEVYICGTTTDITAVTQIESEPVGTGHPGPVWKKLHALLRADIVPRTGS